jgi:hypothetical protein
MTSPTPIRRAGALGVLTGLLVLALAAGAAADPAGVSSNWAGYFAVPLNQSQDFSGVSGTWRQPAATCAAGREAYSAVWTGLGGYSERSKALEQIGTDADCSRSGRASYTAWYELIPAAPVTLKLRVHPGDEITSSVTVVGHGVTLAIRDLTTGAHHRVTRHASAVDATSAEWIVEAPSVCAVTSTCRALPLADFGEVAFASATATADGHTGPVGDPDWSSGALELRQGANTGSGGGAARRRKPPVELITAIPSALAGPAAAFSVAWERRETGHEAPPAPSLTGSAGGAP